MTHRPQGKVRFRHSMIIIITSSPGFSNILQWLTLTIVWINLTSVCRSKTLGLSSQARRHLNKALKDDQGAKERWTRLKDDWDQNELFSTPQNAQGWLCACTISSDELTRNCGYTSYMENTTIPVMLNHARFATWQIRVRKAHRSL